MDFTPPHDERLCPPHNDRFPKELWGYDPSKTLSGSRPAATIRTVTIEPTTTSANITPAMYEISNPVEISPTLAPRDRIS